MTSASTFLRELKARLALVRGSHSLLLFVVDDAQSLEQTYQSVAGLLRAASLSIREIDPGEEPGSPARWAQASQESAEDAYITLIAPLTKLLVRPTGRRLNAQREDLRRLAGPLLLFLSRGDEQSLREIAPDFFTWVAQSYEVPSLEALRSLAAASGVAAAKAPEPMVSPIRFLHLSDLHLRPGTTKVHDQERVLGGLLERLKRDRESAQLDLIFVTGDIANSGNDAEYDVACKFLKKVLEITGVPRAHLFVVPGNHDVDRNVSRWLIRTLDSDSTATDFFVEPSSRIWHEKKFDAYRKRLSQVVGDDRSLGLEVGADAVEVVEIRGERLAIASFNSAWFANDDADMEKLWLGDASIDLAGKHIQNLGGAPLSIALMHHPTSYLSEIERAGVEHHIERSFDVVLRGHLHKDRTRVIQSQRGGYLEIAAAAAYQGSQWPNGCFLGELRPANRTVRLRPYTFGSGADPWVLDAKVFPDDEQDEYCHTFLLTERKRDPLGLRAALAAEAPAIVQSLDRPARMELGRSLGVTGKNIHEIEDKAIQALQRSADPADLWKSLDATGQLKLDRLAERLASSLPSTTERIPLSDLAFLEKALTAFDAYWNEHRHTWIEELGSKEKTFLIALHAVLLRMLDGSVTADFLLTDPQGRRIRPDLLIGSESDPPERRAIVEVRTSVASNSVAGGLGQLDRYMDLIPVAHSALVTFNNLRLSPLRHVKTPTGRDVLLLCL